MGNRPLRRQFRVLATIALATVLVAPALLAQSNSSNQLLILGAQFDASASTLYVEGRNFLKNGDPTPSATLSGIPMPVPVVTATQMQITLPQGIQPGSYLLKISRGNGTPQSDVFAVTIAAGSGAGGAMGPKGATGAT